MVYGIDGIIVEVEVDIHNGLPGWGSLQVPPEIAREKKLGIWQCPGYVTDEGFNKDKWCKDGAEKKPDAGYTGPYNPKGPDRDCSDFATRAEAQAFY